MAKHEAPDDAAAHPLVEEGLRHREHTRHGVHRAQLPGEEGPIGWPDPKPDESGEPVGWPDGQAGPADA